MPILEKTLVNSTKDTLSTLTTETSINIMCPETLRKPIYQKAQKLSVNKKIKNLLDLLENKMTVLTQNLTE